MTICELVRDNLEAAVAGLLDGELSRHLEECADCRDTVRRAGQSGRGGAMLRTVRAPVELKEKLKTMARLDQECERAVELFSSALDGEIDASRTHDRAFVSRDRASGRSAVTPITSRVLVRLARSSRCRYPACS